MTVRIPDVDTALVLAASGAAEERSLGRAWLLRHADVARTEVARRVRDGAPGRQDVWVDVLVALGGPEAEAALEVAVDRGNVGEAERARLALDALRSPPG